MVINCSRVLSSNRDTLSRRPDYKNPEKFIKPILVKQGNYMQVTEATEKNNDIIKNAHDTRLTGYQGIFKTLKGYMKKQLGKTSRLMLKNISKMLRPQSQTRKVCRERLPKFALGSLGKRSRNVGNVQHTRNVGNVPGRVRRS